MIVYLLLTLKAQIPGPLEGQTSLIPLDQEAVFRTGHMKFHAVSALHLKCDIVGGGGRRVMVLSTIMVTADIGALGNHCHRYGQLRRMIVPVPLAQPFSNAPTNTRKNKPNIMKNMISNNPKPKPKLIIGSILNDLTLFEIYDTVTMSYGG